MSGAELALAIIGAVDLGFKWGERIRQLCAALKGAPKEISERVVRVEACWMRISAQLDFSRHTADLMDDAHRALHHRTLDILLEKLQGVHRELESVRLSEGQTGPVGTTTRMGLDPAFTSSAAMRIKYAFKKKRIDEAVDDLETWQGVFDISWLLTLKIAHGSIDTAVAQGPAAISSSMPQTNQLRAVLLKTPGVLAENVFLREDGLSQSAISPLPFCDVAMASRKNEMLILDKIVCTEPATRTVTKDVRSLAQSMRDADPNSFGWLRCKGVVKEVTTQAQDAGPTITTTSLTMVFKVPSHLGQPQSLRAKLLEGDTLASLSDKVKLAKDLARAVSYVHIFGFVHKNIRPETILLLHHSATASTTTTAAPSLFLVGFEKFRREDGITYRTGDRSWARGLYRHPRRQGPIPQDMYVMQHDIYSLGVCLLEIGLWDSFVRYEDGPGSLAAPSVAGVLNANNSNSGNGDSAPGSQGPTDVQAGLLTLAREQLPKRMGTKYAEVVETCLTCLDEGNKDFSDENDFKDEDGIIVGVRYVERVITQLNNISV